MTSRAAELLKTLRLLALVRGPLFLRHLDDHRHRRQHVYASLEAFGPLLASFVVAELAALAYGVATPASMSIEHVLGELLRTLIRGDHVIQGGGAVLCR